MNVFLSASIPLLERNPKYFDSADVLLIREAIKGLVLVLLEKNCQLVFGGHPAITPLVRMLFAAAGHSPRQYVTLYQSAIFEADFPKDNEAFEKVVVTEVVEGGREPSLLLMRQKMLRHAKYQCGVFIGGMEGIEEEFAMFRDVCGAPAYPIASTGAAARFIFEKFAGLPIELKTELTYPTLFRQLLSHQ